MEFSNLILSVPDGLVLCSALNGLLVILMASLDKFLGDGSGLSDLVRSPGDCGGQEKEDRVWTHCVCCLETVGGNSDPSVGH